MSSDFYKKPEPL